MKFNYTVSFTPERTLGIRHPNGSWTGLIGSLQRDEGDFALGLMIPTNSRNAIARPTTEVYIDEITILAGRTHSKSMNVFSYVLTFDWQASQPGGHNGRNLHVHTSVPTAKSPSSTELSASQRAIHLCLIDTDSPTPPKSFHSVWVCVVIAMFTLAFLSTGFDYFYEHTVRNRKSFSERFFTHLWEYFENLLGKGSSVESDWHATRLLSGFWWIGVTVLVFAFAGQMRACLMVKSQEAMIRNVDDLARRSNVKPYTLSGSILTTILRNSKKPSYTKVFQRIVKGRGQTELHQIYGPKILKEVVQGKSVVIADRGSFTYKVARTCRNYTDGEFYIAAEPILNFRFVMYLSATMDPRTQWEINRRLVWLRENGIVGKWIKNMLGDWEHCRQESSRVTLSFEDTYAIFVMWALLIAASLVAFGCEKLHHACTAAKERPSQRPGPILGWGVTTVSRKHPKVAKPFQAYNFKV
ncbi:glutamate receptor ionotropic, kainate 1 isoform X1 [Ixodes scapularis]|uniref:glutamate receptor ionotropic, kainate 1 isoform X1 n=1 Tax=Ixodes scapularis TaxID=6945 RepID=UPI001A9E3506|nr:glutamate receptor ionotropic, kainate 1 isoform X1 [Ixodes scapularis]